MSDNPFSVKIRDNLTVDDLKDAIMEKKKLSFMDLEADYLNLWKVSGFPPLSNMHHNLQQDILSNRQATQESV